jgi:hypothetical protein
MKFADIKAHAASYLSNLGHSEESEWHRAITHFLTWAEGAQAEADAKAFLESRGYRVTPPPSPAPAGGGGPGEEH